MSKKIRIAVNGPGRIGRAIIRAVDRNRFKALNAIREAVDKASAKAQARVDSVISQREV